MAFSIVTMRKKCRENVHTFRARAPLCLSLVDKLISIQKLLLQTSKFSLSLSVGYDETNDSLFCFPYSVAYIMYIFSSRQFYKIPSYNGFVESS
jgi:hypothetical protein